MKNKNIMERKAEFWETRFGPEQIIGDSILCSIVHFTGPLVSSLLFEKASRNACLLHPILQSQLLVVEENKWIPRSDHDDSTVKEYLHFESVPYEDESTAMKICKQHITMPIQLHEPYMKIFYIEKKQREEEEKNNLVQQVVIVSPHTVIDGVSFSVFVNDLFNQLQIVYEGGDDAQQQSSTRRASVYFTDSEVRELLGVVNNDNKKVDEKNGESDSTDDDDYNDNVRMIPFDNEEAASINYRESEHDFLFKCLDDPSLLKKLVVKCRREGVTLHSLLFAALTTGSSWIRRYDQEEKINVCVASAVSLRQKIATAVEAAKDTRTESSEAILGTLCNMHGVSYDCIEIPTNNNNNNNNNNKQQDERDQLWKTARDHYKSLSLSLQSKTYITILDNLRTGPVTFYLSNVGKLDHIIREAYGPFVVRSTPLFLSLDTPSPFITVHTIRDRLHLCFSFLKSVYHRETIERLGNECITLLTDIANNETF